MSYDDEYVVTENSDGSYNVHKASYTERSDVREMIETWAQAAADASVASNKAFEQKVKAAKKMPDKYLIEFRKSWMEVSGLNSFKNDVGSVYSNLMPCNLTVPDSVHVDTCFNRLDIKLQGRRRFLRGLIIIALGILLLCISPILKAAFTYLNFEIRLMSYLGIAAIVVGLILSLKYVINLIKAISSTQTYKNKSTGHQISAQSIQNNCSDADAFKWFINSENYDPTYIKYFSTQWTKENPVPLIKGDDSKAKLYAWEKRRRVEDKQYFDCTTNTEWARNNPDVSIYSYCNAITGYYKKDINDVFTISFDHIPNKTIRSRKEAALKKNLYMDYEVPIDLLNNSLVTKSEVIKGRPAHIYFTCGDLYAHLQWLKRRLNEDKEFVQMLPNLKYSPFLHILLNGFSKDERLLEKSFYDTSIGIDLQWYISNTFQDILKQNLAVHSEELESIIP